MLVNVMGIGLILFIIYWFWLSKAHRTALGEQSLIVIIVKEGVYQPGQIAITVGKPVLLRFIREDATPCAETVIFDRLNISKSLPLHTPVDIPLLIEEEGEYDFTCQMAMYKGTLIATKSQ
jgi:plastocyanin domain-containing protein